MALHPNFPRSPYEVLLPDVRWFRAAEEMRATGYEKLLPPLVAHIREEVKGCRDSGYKGASPTSRALLTWWFGTDHLIEKADATQSQFRYYFAQQEAVETVIWLYDVRNVRDKFDLLRFDASGAVSSNMFDEEWPHLVVKMATGAGKTKVFSLLMAWGYIHKLYEPESSPQTLLCSIGSVRTSMDCESFSTIQCFQTMATGGRTGVTTSRWYYTFRMTFASSDQLATCS